MRRTERVTHPALKARTGEVGSTDRSTRGRIAGVRRGTESVNARGRTMNPTGNRWSVCGYRLPVFVARAPQRYLARVIKNPSSKRYRCEDPLDERSVDAMSVLKCSND